MIRFFTFLLASLLTCSAVMGNPGKIKELERELATSTDTARVHVLLDLSVLLLRQNPETADSIAQVALVESESLSYLEGKIRSMIYLGNIKSFQGNNIAGSNYCKQALFLSDSINNLQLRSESHDLSYLLYFRRGLYDSATMEANTAIRIAEKANYTKMMARGNQNLGILNSIKGNHANAITHFLESEKLYEEMNDEFALALLLGNIGVTFEEAGNYPKALEYMHKDLTIGRAINDDFLVGNSLANIGALYSQMNQPDSAILYYEESLLMAEKSQNYDLIIINQDNIGSYYSNIKEYEKATSYLMSAYKLAVEKGFEYQNVYIFGHLAQNYLVQEKYDSALVYALEQLRLALDYEFLYDQKLAYQNLSEIYAAKNEYSKAHKALSSYTEINDSLFTLDKASQIEHLREQYETEKKEQEIENLKAINETARYRNISFAGAAISFLILGGLLYYVQRMRARRNRVLLEKEKELDRLKSRFFANISHEFRTPLTLILGPLDEILLRVEQVDIKNQLKVMQRNAGRLLNLVNQLLDLSKIESGKLSLNESHSDIIPVIRGVAMSFHSLAEQKHIQLELDIIPDKLLLKYDREKLETILTNLLSNAFKFTPEHGKISIQTRVIEKEAEGKMLKVNITDNGKGIPQEEVELIFNRFYQSDTNQLSQHEGSGIGLALTKELIELHGGKIMVESKVGEGTQITFELPVNTREPAGVQHDVDEILSSEQEFEPRDLQENMDDEKGVGSTDLPVVLVVEDHEDVRNYVHDILAKSYSIISAKDGEEGISKAIEIVPDLIVSDVMMPKKDGLEVCHTLKQDEKTSHIPIVLLTAKSDSEDKITGLMTKADDYVTKPFVPRELLIRIENLIESRKQLREKYKKEGVIRPKDIAVNSIDEKFLERLIDLVEINMANEKFGVEQLGKELGMSRSQLNRKLNALLDQGPNQFIRSFRLQRAHDLLKRKAATASEIAYQVGFSSPSYFTKCFHEQFGYTPSEISEINS